jgi:class 3 adenylate cyclase/tetratricopeptide (TPR) repeat protein
VPAPEARDLLHRLAPYLPTDRFRALLRRTDLPVTSTGAALIVDISGFSPLANRLVAELGAQRASDELRRRINPMYEAIAGQVFQHGGSVIHFLGDGFTAWFDDAPIGLTVPPLPGLLRATAAGLQMQSLMKTLFRALSLKVYIGVGKADRWVLGDPTYGLSDVVSGEALQGALRLASETVAGQVCAHAFAVPALLQARANLELNDAGNALVLGLPERVISQAREARWPAWEAEGEPVAILEQVRPFVPSLIRQRVESGAGAYGGELRSAIPMFVRLDASALADSPPDVIRTHLDVYIRTVQERLAAYGGLLMSVEISDKGNVLFAVFGAPIAYGDDAERAVRLALQLRAESRPTDPVRPDAIGLSIGLLYAGTIGGEVRHEYSTIGDETNVAARLMTAAGPGRILASSFISKAVGGKFIFHNSRTINIKGRSEPIRVVEPLSQRSTETVAIPRPPSTLIGRVKEISEITKTLRTAKTGHPRLARITGEAGIGKSRFLMEVFEHARAEGFSVALGYCESVGQRAPYFMWRNLLSGLFELPLTESPAAQTEYLTQVVADLSPDALPRLPLLGDVLDLPMPDSAVTAALSDQTRLQATSALIIELIMRMARRQPLTLGFENIHWIDEISMAILIDLIQRLSVTPAPIFVLMTQRPTPSPETHQLTAALAASRRLARDYPLGDLSPTEIGAVVQSHLQQDISEDLAEFIAQRAQGNPLFAIEIVETLREAGHLTADIPIRITPEGRTAQLPQTVQGLIQSRLDTLSEEDRRLLRVAAVIGQDFSAALLASSLNYYLQQITQLGIQGGEVAGEAPADRLERQLAGLVHGAYLVRPHADHTYAFKHAIIQEVIYQSLLEEQRKVLHGAVANALERNFPDATEALAHHFSLGPERYRAKAYTYLSAAGRKAFSEYANQAALQYFEQAAQLATQPEQTFETWYWPLRVLLRLGDMEGARAKLNNPPAGIGRRADWSAQVNLLWADYYTQTNAWIDAVETAKIAIVQAEQLRDDQLAWRGYILLRGALGRVGPQNIPYIPFDIDRRMQDVARNLDRAVDDNRYTLELVLTWFDEMYTYGPDMAIKAAETTLETARQMPNPLLEAECLAVLEELHLREYNLPAALEAARRHLTLLRQIGDRRREGLTLNRIGGLLINLGRLKDGQDYLLEGYPILQQIGERGGEAAVQINTGLFSELRGIYDVAFSHFSRALAMYEAAGAEFDAALAQYYMGNVGLLMGDVAEAGRYLRGARATIEANPRQKYVLTLSEIDAALAVVALREGRTAEAVQKASAAATRLERGQISGLFRPGVICQHVVGVLNAAGEVGRAQAARAGYWSALQETLRWLREQGWLPGYLSLWFHTNLMES